MSRNIFAFLLAAGLFTMNSALADEVVKSSSTKVDSPDYSASSSSTTTQDNPTATTTQSSTTSEATPYGQEVKTKKVRKTTAVPRTKTTTSDSETTVNR